MGFLGAGQRPSVLAAAGLTFPAASRAASSASALPGGLAAATEGNATSSRRNRETGTDGSTTQPAATAVIRVRRAGVCRAGPGRMGGEGGAIRESHAQGPDAPCGLFPDGWGVRGLRKWKLSSCRRGALVLTALVKASCVHSKAGLLSST